MWSSVYDFFKNNVFGDMAYPWNVQFQLFGTSLYLREYLSGLCSIVAIVFILVLCCLFVYKIIKLIGGLIR